MSDEIHPWTPLPVLLTPHEAALILETVKARRLAGGDTWEDAQVMAAIEHTMRTVIEKCPEMAEKFQP